MRRLEKQRVFICILVSLLVSGLIWSSFLPNNGKPNQGKTFSLDSFKESPLRNGESYPALPPLWQVNQSSIAFAGNATVTSLNRVSARNPGNLLHALWYCHHDTDSSHTKILLRIIDIPNTVFKFINGQTYQYLDIPPPYALASL